MTLRIESARCESASNPVGIDEQHPRLGWQLVSEQRATMQASYRVQVANSREALEAESDLAWDSGEVHSENATHVVYEGPALASCQRYWWRVRVRDNHGNQSDWSTPAFWEMGILDPETWQAEWIVPDLEEAETDNPCPMLRKEFVLSGPVRSARAYVSSLGLYALSVNGRCFDEQRFTPGFTSFHKRLQYQVHDVTDAVSEGENAIGVTLADGWYRGSLWIRMRPNNFGTQLALLAEIHVEYEDGSREVISSDDSWKSTTGPVRSSDLYFGEVYDARLERSGWSQPGYLSETPLRDVKFYDYPKHHLCCSPGEPVRVTEALPPKKTFKTPKGELVVDFGQVIAGTVRLVLSGERGQEVTLRFCEELKSDGNFNPEQLDMLGYQKRRGRFYQVDRYVLKGGGPETFEPRFTFHGFRYVQLEGLEGQEGREGLEGQEGREGLEGQEGREGLEGLEGREGLEDCPGEFDAETIRALVIRSDLPETGSFECSNPEINQLQSNIVWSQKGNFFEIPTDCPQREKMGWTGDIQVYAPTACFLMDSSRFLTKWLRDLAADQYENGMVPHIIPWLPDYPVFRVLGEGGSAAWGDACTIVPWNLHLYYGDQRILEQMYPVMKRWLSFIDSRAKNFIWKKGMHWGDWLEPGRRDYTYFLPWAKKGHVATPYWARSAEITAEVAERLGQEEEAQQYRTLAENIKRAYVKRFVRRDGRVKPSTQGAYVLALAFEMVPSELAPKLAEHLAALVRENGQHLDTGFASTPHLCHVLCKYGHEDLAFALLNQDTVPSWLYEVKQGATTVWESWDLKRPDGSLLKGYSFNHYAFGAIGDWLYRYVAGISPDAAQPGFKHAHLAPHPGGRLTSARAVHRSPHGEIGVAWETTADEMHVAVEVPANTTATLRLPDACAERVVEGARLLEEAPGIKRIRDEPGGAVLSLGSGSYRFRYPLVRVVSL